MNRRERTLLAQIKQDVLDDTKPLAGALRKCVVLGGHAGSAALRDWAQRELRGYDGVDLADIPSYRVVVAPLQVDAAVMNGIVTGQQISPGQLPDFARDVISNELPLRMGVGELEAAARRVMDSDKPLRLALPQSADLVRVMNHEIGNPRQQITELHWGVAAPALMGVLDQVRTALADLVGELRATMSSDDDNLPTPEQIGQAMNVAVHGNRSRVVVTNAQASGESSASVAPAADEEPGLFGTTGRRIGAVVVGMATVIGTAAAPWPLLK
ncbi:AbiTii domain-containing protein [Streptomyces sp. KR55]|uniref:AbiTii domain-containing protein n=1 Tax=Streptomyces sp. KR55 TaxID=3457425 RepID=UPI003FD129B2